MNIAFVDTATPKLKVIDPRGLYHREVAYYRAQPEQLPQARITRFRYDLAGYEIARCDPRLWTNIELKKTAAANLESLFSLSGATLSTDSVDAGWRVALFGSAGVECLLWGSRGSERHHDYDLQLRLVAVCESAKDEVPKFVERYTYGDSSETAGSRNQCGRLVRHDDPAGTFQICQYTLNGLPLTQTRQFLGDLCTPEWPLDNSLRDGLLDSEAFTTTFSYFASGELRAKIDALGNTQMFATTLAGELKDARLQMTGAGQKPHLIVSDVRYNAYGQVESEQMGNGATMNAEYEDTNGRLCRLLIHDSCSKLLQGQHYCYDPVGNILQIEDNAHSTLYYKNQRIDAVSCYRYDSLYQLVEASGRECEIPVLGPQLPSWQKAPIDPDRLRIYTHSFDYDTAGNLRIRHHSNSPTIRMAVSESSNRSLGQYIDGSLPSEQDIANGFDANGNQLELSRGQQISWDARNQLCHVTMIRRDEGGDDYERYIYDGSGRRARKVRQNRAGSQLRVAQVRYLPGVEIHRSGSGERHVIEVDLGRLRVRVLHWVGQPPAGVCNDQILYCLKDHLGSNTLELDEVAGVVSQESYYPFGGTAWRASRTKVDAKYKTVRYSDKERDATGLYYYGFRYYAPWLCRWISPDPAGTAYGQNLYRMVENRPTTLVDVQGLKPGLPNTETRTFLKEDLRQRLDRLDEASQDAQRFIKDRFEPHEIETGSREVRSTFFAEVNGIRFESWFVNEFHEDIWIFKENYKTRAPANVGLGRGELDRFHASDVARYQYELVASRNGFFGKLPSVIRRENVMNYSSLAKTVNSANGVEDLSSVFLTQTPNGKSTLRILDDFELEAISVERVKGPTGQIDFLIHVQPRTIIQEIRVGSAALTLDRHDAVDSSRGVEPELLKGSIRRGSIDMERMERIGSH